jgi:hypothetical protein
MSALGELNFITYSGIVDKATRLLEELKIQTRTKVAEQDHCIIDLAVRLDDIQNCACELVSRHSKASEI